MNTRRLIALSMLLTVLTLALAAPPSRAATITVVNTNNSGAGSLRQAIADAHSGDTITFNLTYPATISLASEIAIAKNLTLTGPGAGSLKINGSFTGSLFETGSGVTVSISGVTITNGHFGGEGIDNRGTLTVENSTFSNGYDGIYAESTGTLTVTNCTFSANSDAAIYNSSGTLNVTASTFSGNGDAIFNSSGGLTVTSSTFSGNTGYSIYNSSGTTTVDKSTFSDNTPTFSGGAVYTYGGTLSLTNSTFSGNIVGFSGGALYVSGGTVTVVNCTFSGNGADMSGGTIYNSTPPTFKNTIIANSTSGGNCYGAFAAASTNNLSTDNTCSPGFTQVTSGQLDLGALTGSPAYYPLNEGSVAIDAGTNTGCPATDQRGFPRPYPPGGLCDIGAYEYAPVLYLYLPLITR